MICFATAMCVCACNFQNNEDLNRFQKPAFNDNEHNIDSLKKVYACESISFENWGDKKATDSCLTFCLINSTKIPSQENVDTSVATFKGIARSLERSLSRPEAYRSFYIIFVEKSTVNGIELKNHAAGMEVLRSTL